jgi:sugar-specific transcriptional regulator TrmB
MQSRLTNLHGNAHAFNLSGLGGIGLEGVQVLVGLGLSGRQARVYLAALKLGNGKVQAIADLSLVSRQEIYRLIDGLQEMGLIQKNITNPTTYTATPIAEAASMLLQQKTTQLSVISQQIKQLTTRLSQNCCNNHALVDLKPCFGTIFEADRGKKYCQALTDAEQSIEVVVSWRRFKQLNIHFEDQLHGVLKKGVKLNIVTEKPVNHHLPKWIKAALLKYPDFQLKILPTTPAVAITVFDQTTAEIAFDPNSSLTKGPDLWTTTPSITALCREYFNAIWTQTKKYR